MYNALERKNILNLARQAIDYYFKNNKVLELSTAEVERIPDKLKSRLACFVTVTINGQLRGCIGHLTPTQSLYKDIIENATAAVFFDSRFEPLTKMEFPQINIEVSILTIPQVLNYSDSDDLLNKLRSRVDGVVISKDGNSATYLPQVWDEIPEKFAFMSSLCLKAGLPADEWKKAGMEIKTYQTENIV